jgi:hypothetical protein
VSQNPSPDSDYAIDALLAVGVLVTGAGAEDPLRAQAEKISEFAVLR